MSSRSGNYAAFYVAEPFSLSTLGAHATEDFRYYNMLRAWKGADASFPFSDSHSTTYNVRDESEWDTTLKPRLRERIRNSKNIVLFLSENTISSRAIREEIDYGINNQGLPVIVIYPGYNTWESLIDNNGYIKQEIKNLWNKLPIFRDSMPEVPTMHIPLNKDLIKKALGDSKFMLDTKTNSGIFKYTLKK